MKFNSLDGGEDGEYNDIYFVEILKIFATQDAFFFGTDLPDHLMEYIIHQILP